MMKEAERQLNQLAVPPKLTLQNILHDRNLDQSLEHDGVVDLLPLLEMKVTTKTYLDQYLNLRERVRLQNVLLLKK